MRINRSIKVDSAKKLVEVSTVIKEIYGDDLHKKRQLSGVLGRNRRNFRTIWGSDPIHVKIYGLDVKFALKP
jgi:hypothetical protein